jgi:RNA polymerase sigma-70 factor (ECF subfamily)
VCALALAETDASGTSWDWYAARSSCLREARRVLRSREDAEEAVQEALMRAWRQRDSCQTPDAPIPWLLAITRNEALRRLGQRQRIEAREPAVAAPEDSEGSQLEIDELVQSIATDQVLSALNRDERRLIRLRYYHDLSQPEVARTMNLPEGTVKVRLHRIRDRLRVAFAEDL